MNRIALNVLIFVTLTNAAFAYEFMNKRKCTINYSKGGFYHAECLQKGSMAQGESAGSITTPDGKEHTYFMYGSKDLFDDKRNQSKKPGCFKSSSVEICFED